MRVADLVGPEDALDFCDCHRIALAAPITSIAAWDRMTRGPAPLLKAAFWLRDTISAPFGVRKSGGFAGRRGADPRVGEMLDFFLIERLEDDILSLTARDSHLDVMACLTLTGTEAAITTSVITHNRFGRAYMLPVGIAHPFVVRAMLRRLA
ncbi:hypothetical protein FHS89_002887 [Rubricella aquisinus]|uniref:DUF2867 domain-containing protein n=1 Tax=Rubricella aquisinus TaxID=2028108 RepID=A0A840X4T1_9RHOB|nr:DUF2867 domain-containing protein [Rubricella aquisinus]MBB5516845.1 hypothetical protein [Rubricella aquisinus]